ncbi:MAG: UDP-N-acetylmuramoyl-tripeptide--D-alanyl-D-alanine ligase [Deltaproteobacteria bacterium]|nr:UDP-N-acetylmuramoyl-tripeptide--D-alanyl-D-alanine ligase [Deltaproteobacteria bacterium]
MTTTDPIPWTIQDMLSATGGELLSGNPDSVLAGVSIDSRNIAADHAFVAIVGDIHNGHGFVEDVVQKGIRAVIINKTAAGEFVISAWQKADVGCIAVDDTTRALGDLAAYNRRRADASVVAITGSNGKTTTRQLSAAVVNRRFNTLSTAGNFNNQIGLPLTLLRLQANHQWAVVEIGTNSPGEIARLAEICNADIGVITNVGPAHLEKLGSLDGVMREKGDLIKKLKHGGRAILNADDDRVRRLADRTDREVILFGQTEDASVRAEAIRETADGITFTLILPEQHTTVNLNLSGRFMVANALAAAAVGYLTGVALNDIKAGLESFSTAAGRMRILHTPRGIHIIDDTYNANPDSMRAALTTLKSLCSGRRSILVSGDMLELGEHSRALHRQIGAQAGAMGIRKLFAAGDFAQAVATGAEEAGMDQGQIFTGAKDRIIEALKNELQADDWVLVKGSRGMAMEEVVEALKKWAGVES